MREASLTIQEGAPRVLKKRKTPDEDDTSHEGEQSRPTAGGEPSEGAGERDEWRRKP